MRRTPRYFGLCLVIPDGVIMDDRLTGQPVVRARTERDQRTLVRLTPAPA